MGCKRAPRWLLTCALVISSTVAINDYTIFHDSCMMQDASMDLRQAELLYSNLGGKGPDTNRDREMRIINAGKEPSRRVPRLFSAPFPRTRVNCGMMGGALYALCRLQFLMRYWTCE